MAFGYEYLMVYLPDFNRESFLLFVHNPAGQTKLRDYSSGKEETLGQPPLQEVLDRTVIGRTRFSEDPHRTTDHGYWHSQTLKYNRHLSLGGIRPPGIGNETGGKGRKGTVGPAVRGSRRQLQDYVNQYEATLTNAVMKELPSRLRELDAHIRWVSPLAEDDYEEYRDADFLRAVGLHDSVDDLANFWPSGGPSWDALAVVSDLAGRIHPGVILVEAKSHIPEIYGNGCQAGPHSRGTIEKALAEAKDWCKASADADWTGPLYQAANRLAHLYFIRERLKRPAWLVNLYFTYDPIGPANLGAWTTELQKVKASLGLASAVPFAIDLFLPALNTGAS